MTKKQVRRPKRPENGYWTDADVETLRKNAGKKNLDQLARLLKRSTHAVEQKASKNGISLRLKAA